MSTFNQVYDIKNLRRAYRWLRTNPDARYKNFFRQNYDAYAIASEHNLKFLSRQIRDGRFIPSHASKVYLPKPSGILRSLSLLTINDQIAYQACVNIVAENLLKKTKHRYNTTVFNHLYAGKTSLFFYRKWQSCYREFSDAIRGNFRSGYKFVATFDLTAFYDSIDHHVLKVFLDKIGTDPDTIEFLLKCLKQWTSATWSGGIRPVIHHEHGIPQGPLSSGMLSEVVLQYLDQVGERPSKDVRYLRYVDDIKLMAKDERTLRRRLVRLDLAAKEIGLFPQGAKISIREITDPEEEIKSISVPLEPAANPFAKQPAIRKRVRDLAGRGTPEDSTRFRFALARLEPSHHTNAVLLKTLRRNPHLADSICNHFQRYARLPPLLENSLFEDVQSEGVYHSINADLLDTLFDRVSTNKCAAISEYCYDRLFARKFRSAAYPSPQPTYRAALMRWALLSSRMTYPIAEALLLKERDWWVAGGFVSVVPEAKFGAASYQALLNSAIRLEAPEPARIAAQLMFERGIPPVAPIKEAHWTSKILLKAAGIIKSSGRPPSLVSDILSYVLSRKRTKYEWKKYFSIDHTLAEKIGIISKQRYETDIDAFIVIFDSFCDQIMRALYRRQGAVMTADYGSVLTGGSPAWLRTNFPLLRQAFADLHALRIRSFTAHPRHKTGVPNRRLRHRNYYRIRKALVAGFDELEAKITP